MLVFLPGLLDPIMTPSAYQGLLANENNAYLQAVRFVLCAFRGRDLHPVIRAKVIAITP